MQVSDILKMDGRRNPTYNSMMPIIIILKVFCLNCNIEDDELTSKSTLIRSFLTVLTLGAIDFGGLYYKIKFIYPHMDLSIKITDCVQMLFDFGQYIVDIYFVYKYGRHICVEYFKQYECIDRILNVTCFSKMKTKLLKLMCWLFTIWMLSSSFDFVAWALTYGWITPTCHAIAYVFLLIKMLTTLDLITHVTHIQVRVKIIGNLIQNCYLSINEDPVGLKADSITSKRWLYNNDETNTHVLVKANSDGTKEVKSLASCYLLLTEQTSFINKIYGFRVMLNSLSLLCDMIKVTNIAVRIILGTQRIPYGAGYSYYYPAMSSLARLLTCAALLITLVDQCEKTYRQRERAVNIMDHLLINKNAVDDLRRAVVNFRDLMQNRPIVFNMANFFSLNYSFLMSVASVFVTYTIILLQSVN